MVADSNVELGVIDIVLLGHVLDEALEFMNKALEFRIFRVVGRCFLGHGLDDVHEFPIGLDDVGNLFFIVGLSFAVFLSLGLEFIDVLT